MAEVDIHKLLDGKWEDGTRPKDIYSLHVRDHPDSYVVAIAEGLSSPAKRIQNGCAELASLLSNDQPELLYPHVEVFIAGLSAEGKVLRWEAVCTLGNLAAADTEAQIPEQIPSLVPFLRDKSIVLQGHTLRALAKIGRAFPTEAESIVDTIVSAKECFPGNKIGFVVEALGQLIEHEHLRVKIRSIAASQENSDIAVVARKSRKVLKQLGKLEASN